VPPTDGPTKLAAELLSSQSEIFRDAAGRLDHASFDRVVDLLLQCRGRVVAVGAGASAVVARRVASMLASTGTPATFMHAADATRGELGFIRPDDVVVAVGGNGDDDPLIDLLPSLARRGVPVVAFVADPRSTLARRADVVLDVSVTHEGAPLAQVSAAAGLVAMAFGDALALTVMEERGITATDYAHNHPAGTMGKRLTVTVGDLMHDRTASPALSADAWWFDLVTRITDLGLGAIAVADANGVLEGLITDGDLRRAVERTPASGLDNLNVRDVMTVEPISVNPEMLAYDALQLMESRPSQINVLPVVDADHVYLGLVRLHDLVRSGIA
jgi:arabinose-5-phosphate isomerase